MSGSAYTEASMPDQPYPKPPIIEAVVEFRVESAISDQLLETVCKKLRDAYPTQQQLKVQQFSIEAGENPSLKTTEEFGRKVTNEDGTDIVSLGPRAFSVSRLAPYKCYEDFSKEISAVWDIIYKQTGYRRITRIGMRYINRIDVELSDDIARYEDFLNLKINIPEKFDIVDHYDLSFQIPLDSHCKARVQSGVMPPAIIGYASFSVDIDVYVDENVPQKKPEIFALLETMRRQKNELFESFVTDKARSLFYAR